MGFLVVGLVATVLLGNQYFAQNRSDETDAWLYRYYGSQMAQGARLYQDVWDNKPPGIYWFNALTARFGSHARTAEFVGCLLATAAACWAAARCAAIVANGWATGVFAALLTGVFVLHPHFMVGGDRPQTFVVAFESLAAMFCVSSFQTERRSGRRLLVGGLMAGVAVSFLQTSLALPAALLANDLCCRWNQQLFRVILLRCFFFIVGLAASVGAVGLLLKSTSDLEAALFAVFGFPGACFAPGQWQSWWPDWNMVGQVMASVQLPLEMAIATVLMWYGGGRKWLSAASIPSTPTSETTTTPDEYLDRAEAKSRIDAALSFLLLWFAFAFVVALLIPNRKWHYFAPCLLPLVLIGSCGAGVFWKYVTAGPARFAVWLLVLWMTQQLLPQLRVHLERVAEMSQRSPEAMVTPQTRSIVDAIERVARADETLFVVGYDPEIYYRASRPPASRFPGTLSAFQLPVGGDKIAAEIVRELQSKPPRVIVADEAAIELLAAAPNSGQPDFQPLVQWLKEVYKPDSAEPRVWVRTD